MQHSTLFKSVNEMMVLVLKCSFLLDLLISALEIGQLKSLGGADDSREFAQIPTTNMQIKQTSKTLVGNLQQMFQACASINSYFYGN